MSSHSHKAFVLMRQGGIYLRSPFLSSFLFFSWLPKGWSRFTRHFNRESVKYDSQVLYVGKYWYKVDTCVFFAAEFPNGSTNYRTRLLIERANWRSARRILESLADLLEGVRESTKGSGLCCSIEHKLFGSAICIDILIPVVNISRLVPEMCANGTICTPVIVYLL